MDTFAQETDNHNAGQLYQYKIWFNKVQTKVQKRPQNQSQSDNELLNCWDHLGPALVSRSLKMCPADAHTTVFGHFSRPKEALNRYAEKICKYSMKEIQQRTKVMLELQQLKKTALQDLILNMATSSCLQSMMDSDTLAKGVEISLIAIPKSARCDYFEKSLAVKCKKAPDDFMPRTLIVVRISNDPVPLSGVSTFLGL